MREDWQSLSHVRWDCKYHVVIVAEVPQAGVLRQTLRQIGGSCGTCAGRRRSSWWKGMAMPDHVHLCCEIPPKYSVAMTVGFLKGKTAIRIHRELLGTKGTLIHGRPLLGAGVLREHRGSGRATDPAVHPRPGGGGKAAGTTTAWGASAPFIKPPAVRVVLDWEGSKLGVRRWLQALIRASSNDSGSTKNSSGSILPVVSMMQATDTPVGNQTRRLVGLGRNRSHQRCVFLERVVDSVCVIIRDIIPDQTAQMNVIEDKQSSGWCSMQARGGGAGSKIFDPGFADRG